MTADLEKAEGFEKVVNSASAAFGHVDILFNNAGHANRCTPASVTDEEWASQLNIHFMACVLTCRIIAPKMIERKWGVSTA